MHILIQLISALLIIIGYVFFIGPNINNELRDDKDDEKRFTNFGFGLTLCLIGAVGTIVAAVLRLKAYGG